MWPERSVVRVRERWSFQLILEPVFQIVEIVRLEGHNPSKLGSSLCQLSVEDNGIGFDAKYVDRIFNPFQRLHGRGDYEGTGIGLAICRKIAERHGGSITARSAPGQGAAFIVTLPARQPPPGGCPARGAVDGEEKGE